MQPDSAGWRRRCRRPERATGWMQIWRALRKTLAPEERSSCTTRSRCTVERSGLWAPDETGGSRWTPVAHARPFNPRSPRKATPARRAAPRWDRCPSASRRGGPARPAARAEVPETRPWPAPPASQARGAVRAAPKAWPELVQKVEALWGMPRELGCERADLRQADHFLRRVPGQRRCSKSREAERRLGRRADRVFRRRAGSRPKVGATAAPDRGRI